MPEGSVLDLATKAYAAASGEISWDTFLNVILGRFSAETTGLVASFSGMSVRAALTQFCGPDAEGQARRYASHFCKVDPFFLRGKHFAVEGLIMTGQMAISDNELERTEFYQDFMRPVNCFHQAAAVISGDVAEFSFLSLLRSKCMGGFAPDELSELNALLPHLRQALRIREKLALLDEERETAERCLDLFPLPLCLLNGKKELLFFNAAFQSILERADGLSIRSRVLRADLFGREDQRLEKLVVDCVAAPRTGVTRGGTITISRPSGKSDYLLSIIPITDKEHTLAAVFIDNPEWDTPCNGDILTELFQLTSAEARLAVLLSTGVSLSAAADALRLSRNTVKTQLDQIFLKTGTNRQSQLVKRLVGGVAGLSILSKEA